MIIRIEIDENIEENEVIIRCKKFDKTTQAIHTSIGQLTKNVNLVFYKNNVEYYFNLSSILFFETADSSIDAHTAHDVYKIKNRLYELEKILPNNFVRISKSTIINIDYIYSIDRNLTSSSCISLSNTHKQVYVSRIYYKILKNRLDERRNYEK